MGAPFSYPTGTKALLRHYKLSLTAQRPALYKHNSLGTIAILPTINVYLPLMCETTSMGATDHCHR